MRFYLVTVFILNISFTISYKAWSQNSIPDTSSETLFLKSAVNQYHSALRPETGLYNGSEYAYNTYYPFKIDEGNPFFKSKIFDTGSVFYNNILYEKVPLLFDLIKGELLTHDPTNYYVIKLNSEKVRWFNIAGNTFIRLTQDMNSNSSLRTGFYDLLYNGKTILYKKISKKFADNTSSSQGVNRYVIESQEFFIKKDSQYYPVNNKKSALLIFKDQKKPMMQFIRKNRLNLRINREEALLKIVAYYDGLNSKPANPVNQ